MGVVLSSIGSLVAGVSDPHGRSMYSSRTVGSPCPAGRTTPLNESATGTRSTFPTKNVCISKAFITTSTDLVIVSSSTHFFALLFVYFGLKLVRLYRLILLVIFDSMFIKWMRWTWPFIAGIGRKYPVSENIWHVYWYNVTRWQRVYVPGRRLTANSRLMRDSHMWRHQSGRSLRKTDGCFYPFTLAPGSESAVNIIFYFNTRTVEKLETYTLCCRCL